MKYRTHYRGKTFDAILQMHNGAGLGFDLLRLGLALTILLSHTSAISGHSGVTSALINSLLHLVGIGTADAQAADHAGRVRQVATAIGEAQGLHGPGRPFTLSHVPMFFALSGFLVAGSALRTRKLVKFIGLRVLRIVPALFVEVLLSAVILGGVLTSLPLDEYFLSSGFWRYFLNIIGYVHYFLPGVFEAPPGTPIVNANLWTLPYEFECYFLMSLLMVTGVFYRRGLITVLFAVATVIMLIANTFYGFQVTQVQLEGRVMVYYFVTGLLFFLWRDKIIFHELAFGVCLVVSYWLMMYTTTVYIYPLMLTYITVFIGLCPLPQIKLLKSGDYSYGIYLYGYPVTRALVEFFPNLRGNLALAAVLGFVFTSLFAAFSWHAIEKHCLKLKRFLSPRSATITEGLHPAAFDPGDAKSSGVASVFNVAGK